MNQTLVAHQIATAMADLAREVIQDFLLADHPELAPEIGTIYARAGSGKRTYHSKRFDSGNKTLLVFGKKMVQSKFDTDARHSWTSGAEIRNRGYYDGDMSLASVLAHTVLHECAHSESDSKNGRKYGSVHNAFFYQCLDGMHRRAGDYVYRRMKELLDRIPSLDSLTSSPKSSDQPSVRDQVYPGRTIWFVHKGQLRRGCVTRVNKQSISFKSWPITGRLGFGLVYLSEHSCQEALAEYGSSRVP